MAKDWYQIAWEGGSVDAMYEIGKLYYHGRDVEKSYATAADWFLGAADAGSAEAMDYLGYMFIYGQGVPQDYSAAMNWLLRAVEYAEDDDLLNTIWDDLDRLVETGYTDWDTINALISG